ncbi:hypothetical protein KIN20_016397 [Parelaphostrongylus tenuis]|uniref:Uncharacterized protein n=1 Tax=Parelaphostrongylus tenuis TaxID=148309 RepID=A0AAD5MZQ7_PARTN|nr:hypothetical protein KIN20_016397 [Parelaphostrongylus tenuis]
MEKSLIGLHGVVAKEWISAKNPRPGFLLAGSEMMLGRNQKKNYERKSTKPSWMT